MQAILLFLFSIYGRTGKAGGSRLAQLPTSNRLTKGHYYET
ncbi:hypothetical protein [Salmonella phage vB_SenS_S528]|uniref:Uncharacterized protein n=1 Tax=Salmonella phage vB_SenS_S528 TaxID=2886211 RepID=A0AAE8Y626_9CAUD|nr:hypothetical protein QA039_gp46 [Salmonella phage vB_SenS_S528]UDL14236.1 hypothetical protein [Salmonella phage vB_SenS_S528]